MTEMLLLLRTLKQWKRYGAGCYEYKCEGGGLSLVVRNVTIPCVKEGQKIDIRLKKGDWLHEGKRCVYRTL